MAMLDIFWWNTRAHSLTKHTLRRFGSPTQSISSIFWTEKFHVDIERKKKQIGVRGLKFIGLFGEFYCFLSPFFTRISIWFSAFIQYSQHQWLLQNNLLFPRFVFRVIVSWWVLFTFFLPKMNRFFCFSIRFLILFIYLFLLFFLFFSLFGAFW